MTLIYRKEQVPQMKPKVIMPKMADTLSNNYLKEKGYDVITVPDVTEQALLDHPDVAAAILFVSPIPNTIYDKLPNLKVFARYGVGYDSVDANYAASKGVWVTNTPGANAVSVAESAVSDLLLLAKRSPWISQKMREGDLKGAVHLMGRDVAGATIGIVGYGNIGQSVAKILSGFNVNVLIYNRTPRESKYGKFVDWDTLFKESDYVTIHLAATPETENSITAKEFAMMKSSASIINLARGPIINENDLISALKTGQIESAALDVFDNEPLPATSPLFDLDNVFLTPHTAAQTLEAHNRMAVGASKMIDQVLTGNTPDWPVNQPK